MIWKLSTWAFGFFFVILIARKSYQDRLKSSAKFTIINYIYISIINILHNDGLHRTLWQTTRLELIHIHRILLNILTLFAWRISFIIYVLLLLSCSSLLLLLILFCLCWFGVLIKMYLYCLNNEWGKRKTANIYNIYTGAGRTLHYYSLLIHY